MKQEKIWDAFQNDESLIGSFIARKRFEDLAKCISRGDKVLNIGVGNGFLEGVLAEKGVDIHCLDPSSNGIEKIKNKLKLGEKAKVGYSQSIPFPDDYFDFVIMSEVLEHLNETVFAESIADVKRVLNNNGRFLGTVPADENLRDGIVVCPNCSEQFHRWGHVQSFSQARLLQMLSEQYTNVCIKRKHYVDSYRLNWKGKIFGELKSIQASLNFKGNNQNFYFDVS